MAHVETYGASEAHTMAGGGKAQAIAAKNPESPMVSGEPIEGSTYIRTFADSKAAS